MGLDFLMFKTENEADIFGFIVQAEFSEQRKTEC